MKIQKKHLILLSSVTMYFFLGSTYAWSIFAQELKAHYGFTMAQSQLIYATIQLTFTVVFILGGKLHDRYGPRIIGSIGGIFFGLGFLFAGLFKISFTSLFFFIGIMGGIGEGFAYICPLASAQKCFPGKKAQVTGTVVAFFGFGPLFIAMLTELLLKNNMPLENIFRLFGIIFLVVITGSALSLKIPGNGIIQNTDSIRIKPILMSKTYWSLFIPMCSGLFAGLLVISNLKPLGMAWSIPELQAAIGVSVIAFFNGAGRISWGFITQRIGENKSIIISLLFQALTLFLAVLFVRNTPLYLIFAAFVGFNYAATLVIYASNASRIYGVENIGNVYPLLFISNGIAGFFAPIIAGWMFDKTGSYSIPLIFAGALCLAGCLSFILLNKEKSI